MRAVCNRYENSKKTPHATKKEPHKTNTTKRGITKAEPESEKQTLHCNGCAWDKYTCAGAAKGGYLLLQREKMVALGISALVLLQLAKDISILQWVRANGCPLGLPHLWKYGRGRTSGGVRNTCRCLDLPGGLSCLYLPPRNNT